MRHSEGIKKSAALYSLAIIGFLSALHIALPAYYNSSFLSQYIDEKSIGLIYFIISIVTILGFLSINVLLKKIGNLRTSLIFIILQIVIFFGIINSDSDKTLIPLFILGLSMINMIIFTFDIFLQKNTEIGHTGTIRGVYMTAINAAWIFGPMLGGFLLVGENYKNIYIASFALLFPLLYLVYKNFNKFHDSKYEKISIGETLIRIIKNKDISKIFIVNIVLQTFYAWMTVYAPLYLHNHIGFNWQEISIILTIMLIPFVIIELPLGKLADKKWGEKEMMILGFLIMGISTISLVLFTDKNIFIWAILLFITRIGAAAAEMMIETYFFKKIDGRDPEMLSMFRTTRPASYFVAPLITTVGLVYVDEKYLFAILGIIVLLTIYPIFMIRDTK